MASAEAAYETEQLVLEARNETEQAQLLALVPSDRAPAVDESIDLYEVLGLDKHLVWRESQDEQHRQIKAAYFTLARLYHPDKIGRMPTIDQAAALHYCQRLTVAYGVLCDEEKKRRYDRQMKSNTWRKMLKRDYWKQLKDDVWRGLTCEDPTWRRQMLISAVLVVAGMVVIGVSGGIAAPAVMIAVGAVGGSLAGAGQLTLFDNLKLKHRDNDMAGLTTGEYCRGAAIGAAIGAVAGGSGAWAQGAVATSSVFADTATASIGGNITPSLVTGMLTRNAVLSSLDVARDVRSSQSCAAPVPQHTLNETQRTESAIAASRVAGRLQMVGTPVCKRYMHVEYDTFDGRFHRSWDSQHSNSACCQLELGAHNIRVTFNVMGGSAVKKVRRAVNKQPWVTPKQPEMLFFESGDNKDLFFYLRGSSLGSWCSCACDFGECAAEWSYKGEWEWWDHQDPKMRPDRLRFKYPPVRWAAAGRIQMRSTCSRLMSIEYSVRFLGRRFVRKWMGETSKGVLCFGLEPGATDISVAIEVQQRTYRGLFMTRSRKAIAAYSGASERQQVEIGAGDGVDAFFNFQGCRFFAYDFGREIDRAAAEWEHWDHADQAMRVDTLGFKHPPANWATFLQSAEMWE